MTIPLPHSPHGQWAIYHNYGIVANQGIISVSSAKIYIPPSCLRNELTYMLQQIGCLTALTSPLLRPIEWYVLRHHPKPRTWCLVSSTERTALNFSVNAYGDLSSSKHVNVVTVCFAATDVYFSFTILTPHRYSLRFIRILTDTLSVTHKYFTIITCLGVPTTLYPHYCRHASTQDCSHGRT